MDETPPDSSIPEEIDPFPIEEKKKLPLVGFGGTFSTRGNSNLIQHSGLACLDFDHLPNLIESLQKIRLASMVR